MRLAVRVVTTDGTATRDDYSPIDQTFVIPATYDSWPLTLYFKGDSILEPDETVTLSIVDCCDDDLVTVGKRTATATIRNDDDGEPPTTYKFGDFPSVWNESQKWLTAPILRFNRLDRPSSATVTLYSFASRRSYEPVVLEFQPGESRKDARFFIDDHFYSAETRVPIFIDSSRRREESRSLTIVDDESPTVVTFEDARVTETATNQRKELFISIDPPSDAQLFFDVKTTAGTASGDFLDIPHYVIVPARTSTGSVPFTLAGDPRQNCGDLHDSRRRRRCAAHRPIRSHRARQERDDRVRARCSGADVGGNPALVERTAGLERARDARARGRQPHGDVSGFRSAYRSGHAARATAVVARRETDRGGADRFQPFAARAAGPRAHLAGRHDHRQRFIDTARRSRSSSVDPIDRPAHRRSRPIRRHRSRRYRHVPGARRKAREQPDRNHTAGGAGRHGREHSRRGDPVSNSSPRYR
jgi:hypothetical protein